MSKKKAPTLDDLDSHLEEVEMSIRGTKTSITYVKNLIKVKELQMGRETQPMNEEDSKEWHGSFEELGKKLKALEGELEDANEEREDLVQERARRIEAPTLDELNDRIKEGKYRVGETKVGLINVGNQIAARRLRVEMGFKKQPMNEKDTKEWQESMKELQQAKKKREKEVEEAEESLDDLRVQRERLFPDAEEEEEEEDKGNVEGEEYPY